jgi:hypothetical protein
MKTNAGHLIIVHQNALLHNLYAENSLITPKINRKMPNWLAFYQINISGKNL